MKIVPCLGAALLLMTGSITAAAQTEIKLTVSTGHPLVFLWVKHVKQSFIPAVNAELAKTGRYKINWIEAYGGTLAKLASELETIEQGVSDLGLVVLPFHTAKLPLHNITFMTPFGPTDPTLVVKVMEELQASVPALSRTWDRYNQVYLVGLGYEQYQLVTKFPLKRVEDLKGKKIGSNATNTAWMQGSGAVGVVSTLPNMYNDLKSGVLDGIIMFPSASVAAKFHEVAPSLTQINFGATYGQVLTVNRQRWEKLPDEVKQAMRAAAQVLNANYHADVAKRSTAALEEWQGAKGTVASLAGAEREKFARSLRNPTEGWLVHAEKAGLPGKEFLRTYMDAMRKAGVKYARDWDKE